MIFVGITDDLHLEAAAHVVLIDGSGNYISSPPARWDAELNRVVFRANVADADHTWRIKVLDGTQRVISDRPTELGEAMLAMRATNSGART